MCIHIYIYIYIHTFVYGLLAAGVDRDPLHHVDDVAVDGDPGVVLRVVLRELSESDARGSCFVCIFSESAPTSEGVARLGAYLTPSFWEEGQLDSRGKECDLKAQRKLGPLFSPHHKLPLQPIRPNPERALRRQQGTGGRLRDALGSSRSDSD